MRINKIFYFNLYCFFLIITIMLLSNDYISLLISAYSLFIISILYIKYGIFDFRFLYVLIFIVFYVSRYVLDALGYFDVKNINYFVESELSYGEFKFQSIIVFSSLSVLFFISNGIILYNQKIDITPLLNSNRNAIIFLLSLSSLCYLIKYIIYFSYFKSSDYLLFQLGYNQINQSIPLLVRYFSYTFEVLFIILLVTSKSVKSYLFSATIFISFSSLSLLIGSRLPFVINILLVLWIFGRLFPHRYISKFMKIKILILSILMIFLLQIVSYTRMEFTDYNYLYFLIKFFEDQGITLNVLSIFIQYSNNINFNQASSEHVSRYISIFLSPVLSTTNLLSLVENVGNSVNSTAAELGYGLGGSILAELFFFFGRISPIIFGFLFYLYCRLSNFYNNQLSLAFISIFMIKILSSPRGYAFDFISDSSRPLFFLVVVLCILKLLNHYKFTKLSHE